MGKIGETVQKATTVVQHAWMCMRGTYKGQWPLGVTIPKVFTQSRFKGEIRFRQLCSFVFVPFKILFQLYSVVRYKAFGKHSW